MRKLRLTCFTIFLYCCLPAFTQTLKFDNYTSKDGLISDDVYKIFQDKKGYLWLCTSYGVMKYNGKTFEQVLSNLPFSESFMYSFYENERGQKWFANSNCKIYEVRNDSAFIIKGTESLSRKLKNNVSEIFDLFVNKVQDIYISTKGGAYKFDRAENYKPVPLPENTLKNSIYAYALQVEDHLVPCVWRNKLPVFINNSTGPLQLNVLDLENPKNNFNINITGRSFFFTPRYFKKSGGNIYFIFHDVLIEIKPDHSVNYIQMQSYILNYAIGKNGHIWAGTLNNGLYELDQDGAVIHHYLAGKTINHVLIDTDGGLWASSVGSGLFHCKNLDEEHFDDHNLLGNINYIKKIEDRLFLAGRDGSIFSIKNGAISIIQKKNEAGEILDISKCDSSYILCHRFKTEFLDPNETLKNITISNPPFLPMKMIKLENGAILCISRKLFLILDKGLKSIIAREERKHIDPHKKVLAGESRNEDILIGTDDGVYLFVNGQLVQPAYLSPTKTCEVVKLVADKNKNFWFCTKSSGLFKLSPLNELSHYTITEGLPSNIINDISFNAKGDLLLSTNKGLFYSQGLKNWKKLYDEQVKFALEFNANIYLATEKGLVIIKNNPSDSPKPPYFNLASVVVNGQKADPARIVELEYDQNDLVFNFDVMSFSGSVPPIFYNLEGCSRYSSITSNQQLALHNLSPGSYTLTASLVENDIHSEPIRFAFSIKKPLWQTGWFIALSTILVLAVLLLILWKVFKMLKRKENKKNEINRLIMEYKLVALKAQINPHFMSNCLMAIQHLILNNKVNEANEYLAKFSLLVRQVLNFSSKPTVTLKEELEITQINIELEQLRFENKFTFNIIMENVDPVAFYVPSLILQPMVENAIWHGLLPLKALRQGDLKIRIRVINSLLNISVEDNGVGRVQKQKVMGNLKESKGIDLTRQRIHNLNTVYNNKTADLIYEDLLDPILNPTGTRATIILPVNLIPEKE